MTIWTSEAMKTEAKEDGGEEVEREGVNQGTYEYPRTSRVREQTKRIRTLRDGFGAVLEVTSYPLGTVRAQDESRTTHEAF